MTWPSGHDFTRAAIRKPSRGSRPLGLASEERLDPEGQDEAT